MIGVNLTLGSLAFAFVALAALFALGLYVTRTYPNPSDPARNARRFVIPAAVLVIAIIAGALGFLLGLIFLIVRL